jgi:hypothetical protein
MPAGSGGYCRTGIDQGEPKPVSKTSSNSELSLEEEKEAWRRHHIESLLESACNSLLQENPNARGNGGSRARVSRSRSRGIARRTRSANDLLAPKVRHRTDSLRRAFGVECGSARSRSRGIGIIHVRESLSDFGVSAFRFQLSNEIDCARLVRLAGIN